MKIVVIGGTGLIGTKLVNNLRQRGHEVVAAAPSSGVNTLTGEGLAGALAGARVVVDVANSPSFEDRAVLERATQFFEFVGGIAQAATDGQTVRLSPALMQPIVSDDVAAALADVAVGEPRNGTVELAGPEPIRMDEFVRRFLAAKRDPGR